MFERFHRVENVPGRTYEGTGIGLSLVKELVMLHHGTISVRSREKEGSTFTIMIPVGRDHHPADQVSERGEGSGDGLSDMYIEETVKLGNLFEKSTTATGIKNPLLPTLLVV